jgi:hypothetical protein
MQPALGLLAMQQDGAYTVAQMLANTNYPSATNGGVNTVNPANGSISANPTTAFGISYDLSNIANDLGNTGRTITINMTTSSSSGSQVNVSINGAAHFSVGSFLQFAAKGSTSYDMSKAQGASASATVSVVYTGYSMIPSAPLAYNASTGTGWYSGADPGSPITQAIKNGTGDVTGFKFMGLPSTLNLAALAQGGNVGFLNNVLIANYPTITITYTNADYNSFKQVFQQQVSGSATLFGFIPLGSANESSYSMTSSAGANNSTFTVTFAGSSQVATVGSLQQKAYVIGGAITNPGVNP